ncbi:MAG: hypothetical protein IPQ07_40910 [Myxococcales bacterium]|nr:hypothetical protein [Myxococcales bacterium]
MLVLLASYGSRTRADNVTQVDVVSETVVRSQAKLYDLRTGAVTKGLRTIDIAYAKDGRLLRRLGDAYQVIHPDGRAVILSAPDVSGSCLFVGDAFVTKDNRYDRALPYGVYDTNTGVARSTRAGAQSVGSHSTNVRHDTRRR